MKKKRKLKGYVLPTVYLIVTITIFASILLVGSAITFSNEDDYDYSTGVMKDATQTVLIEDEVTTSNISSPVVEGTADIKVHYYSKDADEEMQKSSLIYYENTYLPNTGVLYSSDKEFEVKTIFGGKVVEIAEDEFFGKYVVVEHTNSLRSYYYGLDNINVKVNDEIENETVLGVSKENTILNDSKSFLIEVYHNNELINPEKVIGTKVTDYD